MMLAKCLLPTALFTNYWLDSPIMCVSTKFLCTFCVHLTRINSTNSSRDSVPVCFTFSKRFGFINKQGICFTNKIKSKYSIPYFSTVPVSLTRGRRIWFKQLKSIGIQEGVIVRSSSSFVDVDALVIIYFTLVGSTHVCLLYELVLHALLSRPIIALLYRASLMPHCLTLQKVSCCCCSRCMYLPSLTRCPSVYVVHLLSFSHLFGSGSGLVVCSKYNSTFLFDSASSSCHSLPFPRCVT